MSNQALFAAFGAEIEEMQNTLLAATTGLGNPLGDLVRAQIRQSQPPICGAVVLAVSKPDGAAAQNGDQYRKRILLAAALEMLHIALNIHRLLVNAAITEKVSENGDESNGDESNGDESLDRVFIGSTILAGDYCFSRAAQLAAQTDHPQVVATFSLALQTVSEELLREQFNPERGSYNEMRQLLESGAQAAALLVGLSAAEQQTAIELSHDLAAHWTPHQHDAVAGELSTGSRDTKLPRHWQALYHWLNYRRGNGELPAASSLSYP